MSRTPATDRSRLTTTVDTSLLEAVDTWLGRHPGADRASVIDEALRLWYADVQAKEMEEQYTGPSEIDSAEWETWRTIRDAAAARQLARRDRP